MASSSSPSTPQGEDNVFLSFRGADTRFNVVEPLYSSLLDRGISTFRDEEQLRRGGDIPREIFEAIENSRISVVIFSENYASSTWCLDELAKILDCKNSQQQIVLPIFYHVDPSDVRYQRGTFSEAFDKHESRFKDDLEKVSRWRSALTEAANLPGMVLSDYGHESKFIHEITEMIARKLNRAYLTYETDYLVGIDSRVREINDLLGVGAADVRMVGIWGIAGMGKTTLAKAVYNSVGHKFEGSCFLGNVRENSEAPGGLVQLQKTLLHNILGLKVSSPTNVDSGVNIIKSRLRHKRVLLVLDGVDQLDQLKYLAGSSHWFGVGSRIIISTRDNRLLHAHGVDFTYQVKELEDDEAMELFHSKAFPTSRIPNDYLELPRKFIDHAQGNPLALTTMASLLCGKSVDEWHSILESVKAASPSDIPAIVKITKKRLNEAKSPEKLLDQDEEDYRELNKDDEPEGDESEADDVDGVNAAETNKGSPEGHVISANSSPNMVFCRTFRGGGGGVYMQGNKIHSGKEVGGVVYMQGNGIVLVNIGNCIGHFKPGLDNFNISSVNFNNCIGHFKGFSDRIFLIISLILEIISAICDQLSSSEKPELAEIGMGLAIAALAFCVFELIYKGRKGKVKFGRCRMCLWWFYCPQTGRLFGTLPGLFGLICGISQCASSIVQCVCVLRRKDNPFKVNLLPIIFLLCVGGSKLFEDCKRCTKYSWPVSSESPDSGVKTMPLDPTLGLVEGGTVSGPSSLLTGLSSIPKKDGTSNEISSEEAIGDGFGAVKSFDAVVVDLDLE